MSDLQVALIVLGAFIIAGVVIYNWLQERKLRREVTSEFIVPQKDVLADDFHIDADAYVIDKEMAEVVEKNKKFEEHSLHAESVNAAIANELREESSAPAPAAPVFKELTPELPPELEGSEYATLLEIEAELHEEVRPEPIVEASLREKLQSMQASLPDAMHSQIDLAAILYATKDISGRDLSALAASLADIGLPNAMYGLDKQSKWHAVNESAAATYKQVACSLQLADRGGPAAKNLLNKFQFAVEDAGLALNAHVEWQGSGDALQRAMELDQFCIEVDQMVSVHIAQGENPIHGTKFKGLAEAAGMLLKEDGKFHFYANEAPLFVAIDTNNVPFSAESLRNNVLKSITFQIEIPKVNNCEQVFGQMIAIAQKMASSLGANLVDDNQKPLGDIQIERIKQQLKVIHATMVARGIMPGSPSSMRLFS